MLKENPDCVFLLSPGSCRATGLLVFRLLPVHHASWLRAVVDLHVPVFHIQDTEADTETGILGGGAEEVHSLSGDLAVVLRTLVGDVGLARQDHVHPLAVSVFILLFKGLGERPDERVLRDVAGAIDRGNLGRLGDGGLDGGEVEVSHWGDPFSDLGG